MFHAIRSASAYHRVTFCENRSNGCEDIAILRFSKMVSAEILDLQKFIFLTTSTFVTFQQRIDRSWWNLTGCRRFGLSSVPSLKNWNFKNQDGGAGQFLKQSNRDILATVWPISTNLSHWRGWAFQTVPDLKIALFKIQHISTSYFT